MLKKGKYKIKVLNTINFAKSMHYNPFAYIRSEKDILKLVNTIIVNTKGEGQQSGEDFWIKAEKLYYTAFIAYIWYEAPEEEQNFAMLIDMIDASEAREDDENFKNAVDLLFEELEADKPNHFAVRQYKKYKLAAGVVCSKRLLNQAVGKSLRTHNLKPKKGAQVMRKNEKITALYERLSRDDFGKDDDQQRESNSISNQKAMLEEFAARQGLGKLSDSRYATLDAQYEKEQSELTAEISALEKAVKSYEKHEKDADRFIALIDKYENFDKLTIAMLNEFIEKILVHERDRKGSIQTTQEVEIYFNFVGRFVPPAFGEVELTPEELEEIRKREERKDRLHQNYLKRKASGAQKRYEDKIKGRKKAEIEAKKAAIRAEDIAKGVFVPVSSLPQREPMKGVQTA